MQEDTAFSAGRPIEAKAVTPGGIEKCDGAVAGNARFGVGPGTGSDGDGSSAVEGGSPQIGGSGAVRGIQHLFPVGSESRTMLEDSRGGGRQTPWGLAVEGNQQDFPRHSPGASAKG